jgi:hypothetical protein
MGEIQLNPAMQRTSFTPKLEKFASLTLDDKYALVQRIAKNLSYIAVWVIPAMIDPVYAVQRGYGMPGLVDAKLVLDNGKPEGFRSSTWAGIVKTCEAYSRFIQTYFDGKTPSPFVDWSTQKIYDISGRTRPAVWTTTTPMLSGQIMAHAVTWLSTTAYYYGWLKNIILQIPNNVASITPSQARNLGITASDLAIANDAFAFFSLPLYRNLAPKMIAFAKQSTPTHIIFQGKQLRYSPIAITPVVDAIDQIPALDIPSATDKNVRSNVQTYTAADLSKFFTDSGSSLWVNNMVPDIARLVRNKELYLEQISTAIEISRIGMINEEVAGQAVSAGILDAPELPFYQNPLFTLGVAGGIFTMGYAILRKRK